MSERSLKAFFVRDKDHDHCEIIFAETPGKAKQLSEAAHWDNFTEIQANRAPQFDPYASLGFVPTKALLQDDWQFECGDCYKELSIEDNPVVADEHVYCREHAPGVEGNAE